MKTLSRFLIALSLATTAVLSAQTQTTPEEGQRGHGRGRGGPGGHGGFGRGGHPIVRALDADKDGELSATELANASASIRALDKNGDGNVSIDEFRPARPADAPELPADAPARKGPPPGADGTTRTRPSDPVMLALDANSDHALSAAEIANATASLKALDANGDGKLTRDELHPLPPASN